ncbi:MAG: hypothetical protein Q9161_006446 [Pseudevernia consocians]
MADSFAGDLERDHFMSFVRPLKLLNITLTSKQAEESKGTPNLQAQIVNASRIVADSQASALRYSTLLEHITHHTKRPRNLCLEIKEIIWWKPYTALAAAHKVCQTRRQDE